MLITIKNIIGSIRNVLGIVTDGLKMWLPFESSGSDTSGNSNNATLYTGKALSFDGVNDSVDFTTLDLTGEFTIGIWFNVADTLSDNGIYGNGTTSDNVSIQAGGQNFRFRINNSSTTFGFGSGSINTWYRLIITRDDSNLIKCYRNGVASTTTKTDSNTFSISNLGKGFTSWRYNGKASDFQIWNKSWTQADVTYDYNKPNHLVTDNSASTIALSNLKGYWHLSEGAGAINYDSSGESNNGTINGATWSLRQATIPQLGLMDWSKPTIGSDVVTLISDPNDPSKDILDNTVRLREHSLNLDGSGYAKVDPDSSLDIANYSIDGWFYSTNNSSTWEAILTKLTQDNFEVYIRNSQLKYYNSTDSEKLLSAITLNAWTYFCITESGGTLKCYINDANPTSNSVTQKFNTSGHIYIGSHQAGDYSNALIDDIRVYNGVLSADEVLQNYNAGLNQHKTGSDFSDDFSGDYGN